jgi:osmotically-inducible protein OsmY
VSDTKLRIDVEDELLWEPRVDSGAIAVAADGGIVTLRGTVSTVREKLEATNAAKRVHGVTNVVDDLDVDVLQGDRRPDTDLRADVLQALMLNALVPSSVDAIVDDGVVKLTGTAPYQYERSEAQLVAGNVPGVARVDDEIELDGPAPKAEDVRHSIKEAFKRNAKLDAETLSVSSSNGTVTVSGVVGSWSEHDAAVEAAWAAPGVRSVEDEIVVDY